jgi:DNA-binding NarL/FixJ family response regulator
VVAVDLSQRVSHERLRAVLSNGSAGRIVAVSPSCGPLGLRRAVRAGADPLVLEPELEDALAAAVRAVAAGLSAVPAALCCGGDSLIFSHSEREVLRLAFSGHTNGEIATALFLAEGTFAPSRSTAT